MSIFADRLQIVKEGSNLLLQHIFVILCALLMNHTYCKWQGNVMHSFCYLGRVVPLFYMPYKWQCALSLQKCELIFQLSCWKTTKMPKMSVNYRITIFSLLFATKLISTFQLSRLSAGRVQRSRNMQAGKSFWDLGFMFSLHSGI